MKGEYDMSDERDFDKYLDFGKTHIQEDEKKEEIVDVAINKDQPEIVDSDANNGPFETKANKEEKKAKAKGSQEEPYIRLNLSEEEKKAQNVFKEYILNEEKRMQEPDYQEALAKRKLVFSPKTEKLFAGYLLLRGFITEEQAKEYLRMAIPNAKESDLEPERFEDIPEEIKNRKIHVKTK